MRSDYVVYGLDSFRKGDKAPSINIPHIETFLIPLPPLEEQKRSVAKIEELLPHIEKYEEAEQDLTTLNQRFPAMLKRSILQDAIQGKLVPQDVNDTPISTLIASIRKEKETLVKSKKIKADKKTSFIFRNEEGHYQETIDKETHCIDDELPFDIPTSWQWIRLIDLSKNIHYGYNASAQSQGNSKLLRITDIQDNSVEWDTVPYCTVNEKEYLAYGLNNHDIMIARTGGTIGKSFIVEKLNDRAVFASYLIRVIPCTSISELYLKHFLGSPWYWEQLKEKSMGTGQPNVNGTALKQLLIPLPPLEEQKRIVEKIEILLKAIGNLTH